MLFFFFSSRRRHTRFDCDWSSDVCSSDLARDGMPVTDDIADLSDNLLDRLKRWPPSAKIFLKPDGTPLTPGDTLVQSDLADTLETIAKDGPHAFYRGPIANKIAAAVQAAGGVMTAPDLDGYTAFERPPVDRKSTRLNSSHSQI